jgi:hypothetical protein
MLIVIVDASSRRWSARTPPSAYQPREATRGASPEDCAGRSPLHTVYMSAESIAKALADPSDEPEEVIAIEAAA